MTLSEIKKLVEEDLDIDSTELGKESLRSPQLHNKYLCFLLDEKNNLHVMESYLKALEKDKWLYYAGKMSEEQLKQKGWEPFDLAIIKQDIDRFIESDKEYAEKMLRFNQQKEKVNYLENVVKIMSNRAWNVKSAIEWIKFTQGIS
jgi:hypothetical protein